MVQTLKFYKTNSVPVDYEANSVYLYKDSNDILIISITDDQGDVVYSTHSSVHVSNTIQSYVTSQKNIANGIAGLDSFGNLTLPVHELIMLIDGQNTEIKTDNDYVWDDLIQEFNIKGTFGSGNPTFGVWRGNFQGLLFSASAMNQVWCDFHIRHDYALGTAIYPHIHWLPITTATGTVRWGIEWCYAEGHNVASFSNPVTVYIEHTITSNSQYKHMVSEVSVQDAIILPSLTVDGVIKTRIFRDGAHPNDTYPGQVHAWQADLHYQKARLGTKNKTPNFFGA